MRIWRRLPKWGTASGWDSPYALIPGIAHFPGSVGDYFCAGAYGTYFWVDPQEKMFAVMMVQMQFPQSGPYRRAMRELVYGALVALNPPAGRRHRGPGDGDRRFYIPNDFYLSDHASEQAGGLLFGADGFDGGAFHDNLGCPYNDNIAHDDRGRALGTGAACCAAKGTGPRDKP